MQQRSVASWYQTAILLTGHGLMSYTGLDDNPQKSAEVLVKSILSVHVFCIYILL